MEHLFAVTLRVVDHETRFQVSFDQEQYMFQAEDSTHLPDSFALKREHDEWHEQGALPPAIKAQAVEALEKYLLRQH
jgi:hypothetical protein